MYTYLRMYLKWDILLVVLATPCVKQEKSLAKLTSESLYTTLPYPQVWFFSCTVSVHDSDFRNSPVAPIKWQNMHKLHTWRV